MEHSVGF